MYKPFSDLVIVELAGVLAGPSVGLFFAELGAKVIKIENPKTNGDVTRSWKSPLENKEDLTSAYYWSVNAGKEIIFLDLTLAKDLETFYVLIKTADILISNYKFGDDHKLKVDYETLVQINPHLCKHQWLWHSKPTYSLRFDSTSRKWVHVYEWRKK